MARYAVTMLSGKNSIVPVFVPNYCPSTGHDASHTYTARARSDLVGPRLEPNIGQTRFELKSGSSDTRQMMCSV